MKKQFKNILKINLIIGKKYNEVIPALFYPSCSAVSVKLSKSMLRN